MTRNKLAPGEKPLHWLGSAYRELKELPEVVQDEFGHALSVAQFGKKHPNAKPWHGEGPGVFELVEDHRGDTYRAVYTVRFKQANYVLHVFQKKSTTGIKTARKDKELITQRMKSALLHYEEHYGKDI